MGSCRKGLSSPRLTSDLGGRASFAGRDHDEQLHDGVVDLGTARLDDENILLPDAGQDLNRCLALERLPQCRLVFSSHQNRVRVEHSMPALQHVDVKPKQKNRSVSTNIGELREFRLSSIHAQILTYLA